MRARNTHLYIVLLLIASCLALPVRAGVIPNQLIVKFKPGAIALPQGLTVSAVGAVSVRSASLRALNVKYRVAEVRQLYRDALAVYEEMRQAGKLDDRSAAVERGLENDYILTFAASQDVQQAAAEYRRDASVEAASVNSRVRAYVTPNDPDYALQTALPQIKAPQGWARTTGDASAIIAVIDTGLNYNHEDFAGKVDLPDAKNYVAGTNDPLDDNGHGTEVSGVIGAVTNNSKGIAGVDWSARILPLKVLDNQGQGDISNVSAALAYLAAKKSAGLNVVAANMSLGQYNVSADKYAEEDPAGIKERCQEAYDAGIVLVAAAGNGGADWNSYPAYYPTVIAAAAVDQNDIRSFWGGIDPDTGQQQASNYGVWVDVSAPGTNIFSTEYTPPPNGSYGGGLDGTSFASPYVAGLVGLVRAAFPSLTPAQVMDDIKTFADNIDSLNPGYAGKLGTGRINVFRALKGLISDISLPTDGSFVKGAVAINGTVSGWNFASYEVDALNNGALDTVINTGTVSIESGLLGTWNTAGRNGTFTLRLRAYANGMTSQEASVGVTVDNITPQVVLTAPAAGASVQGTIQIAGTAQDANLDHYSLDYGAGASSLPYQNIGTFYTSVNGGNLTTWETSGLTGAYTLRLTAIDKAGNVSREAIPVTILTSVPTKAAQPVDSLPLTFVLPNPFIRAGTGGTTEATFSYSLAGNFNSVIYLFDLNGRLIWQKSYAAGENGGKAGANSPAWSGVDLFGSSVANGVYLYQIVADKKVIARGKIIVLN